LPHPNTNPPKTQNPCKSMICMGLRVLCVAGAGNEPIDILRYVEVSGVSVKQ
jgi:hypothetical protein